MLKVFSVLNVLIMIMTVDEFISEWRDGADTVTVHTSGSTGAPKAMRVEKRRMAASARITCSFLGLGQGDTALICLPADYIAGKMMVVRAEVCGLKKMCVEPSGHPLAGIAGQEGDGGGVRIDFAAMIPMQVYNSLQVPAERDALMQIRHLIIGGGAVDDALAAALRGFPNAVWSTYGMTETLSHIALRRLSGPEADGWYTPFHGVGISLSADGCLCICAPAVCALPLVTNDIAEIAPDGRRFRIIGRKDNVIVSGGIKIQIEEVERMLRPRLACPFMITKAKNEKYGEIVVMLAETGSIAGVEDVCRRVLPKYWQPRRYMAVSSLPMTPNGKPARRQAEIMAAEIAENQ